ncbi:hypothetical protein B296_00021013 [Ensete ventricosum]|uniref:Uncharacterized protein n=1 Tax=Ensete ventricosum TaxID=4639 RepID=A0A426Y703_ENSVE|nr:hypothetical protein B296_00021013 [Ensete ventricosum]
MTRPPVRVAGHGRPPVRLPTASPQGAVARDQGCCQQVRPLASMAGAYGRRQRPQRHPFGDDAISQGRHLRAQRPQELLSEGQ